MLVLVFLVGGADALSAAPSAAWLEPPTSPNAKGERPESCVGAPVESIFAALRFLLVDGEAVEGVRATWEVDASCWPGEVIEGEINSF